MAASSDSRYVAREPMTMPSSTSQSTLLLLRGRAMGSLGPISELGCLKKTMGIFGGGLPDSAAWAA